MNIDCKVIQGMLPQYQSGTASPSTRAAVEEHLRECAACRAYLDEARQPVKPLKASPAPRNPEVASEAQSARSTRHLVALIIGGLLTVLLCIITAVGLAVYYVVMGGPATVSNNIADYGSFQGRGRYSNLEIFPRRLPASAQNPRYYYFFQDTMMDATFQIYLETTLSEADYQAEVERLSNIRITNNDDTHPIVYDTENFPYPAYVTIFANNLTYEYALLIEEEHKIVYIFTQFAYRKDLGFDPAYLPRDFQDINSPNANTLGGYNLYLFGAGPGAFFKEKEWKLGQ